MYLKTKIAEVHQIPNEEGPSGLNDPSVQLEPKLMKPMYNPINSMSAKRSVATGSKVSVYFTPNDCVEQPQLQLSPMHINFIQENLNTFPDCIKPSESMCKFDFDMHRLETNLEKEIIRRRRRIGTQSDDDDDDDDETIEINPEKTRMLNETDITNVDNMAINSPQGYIRLNTLKKHNKYKRPSSSKDLYYSLENLFDQTAIGSNLYQMHLSNKTIDETSETQMTSSASDNCSSNDMSRTIPANADDQRNPSQSVLVLNEVTPGGHTEIQTSNSMPNISKSIVPTKEDHGNTEHAIVHYDSHTDQMLPN